LKWWSGATPKEPVSTDSLQERKCQMTHTSAVTNGSKGIFKHTTCHNWAHEASL
jgi:hypothetical protein